MSFLLSASQYTQVGWGGGEVLHVSEISEGFLPPLSLIAGLSGIP